MTLVKRCARVMPLTKPAKLPVDGAGFAGLQVLQERHMIHTCNSAASEESSSD